MGILGQKSTYIELNTFGRIQGACSTFTPKRGEEITDMQLIYTDQHVTAVIFKTNYGETVFMGARVLFSKQTEQTTFPGSYVFMGFHGRTSSSYPMALGYVIFY